MGETITFGNHDQYSFRYPWKSTTIEEKVVPLGIPYYKNGVVRKTNLSKMVETQGLPGVCFGGGFHPTASLPKPKKSQNLGGTCDSLGFLREALGNHIGNIP